MMHFDSLLQNKDDLSVSFFEKHKEFTSLKSSKGKLLFRAFVQKNYTPEKESYSFSLGYYLITGRNGAWIYGDENYVMIVCKHPNLENEFLFFAPEYKKQETIKFFNMLDLPEMIVSRVPSKISDFEKGSEKIMDWVYPSHSFSTNDIANCEGLPFKRIRRKLAIFKQNDIRFVPNDRIPLQDLMSLLEKQSATLSKTQNLPKEEILNSLMEGIQVYEQNKEFMSMGVFYKDNVPFALIIWDQTLSNHANFLWLIHDVSIDNICYTLYHNFSQYLQQNGIEYFNAGGSETQGLNDFKMKFRPVQIFSSENLVLNKINTKKIAA